MGIWSAVGAIGSSLLGGLFGKKKQTTTTTVDYQKMAASAQAAGFNPLTAIRNGGSAGFTTTTSPTVSAMPEVLSNLGGVLGDALDKKLDPIEAKKREVDSALLDYQLKQFKQGPDIPGRFYPAREYIGTKVSQQNVPRLGAASHKQTASAEQVYGPPSPEQYVKDNGGMELWIPTRDRFTNKVHWAPNPELPDVDQMFVPSAVIVGNEGVGAAGHIGRSLSEWLIKPKVFNGTRATIRPSMGVPRPARGGRAKPPSLR